ncbi:MAG: hypothetical protein ACE14W_11745, partial [Candidatus Velamenicoccus archaeovorus]
MQLDAELRRLPVRVVRDARGHREVQERAAVEAAPPTAALGGTVGDQAPSGRVLEQLDQVARGVEHQ